MAISVKMTVKYYVFPTSMHLSLAHFRLVGVTCMQAEHHFSLVAMMKTQGGCCNFVKSVHSYVLRIKKLFFFFF